MLFSWAPPTGSECSSRLRHCCKYRSLFEPAMMMYVCVFADGAIKCYAVLVHTPPKSHGVIAGVPGPECGSQSSVRMIWKLLFKIK